MVLGVVVGVWMGRSAMVDRVIRPILDAAADHAARSSTSCRSWRCSAASRFTGDRRGGRLRRAGRHQDHRRRDPRGLADHGRGGDVRRVEHAGSSSPRSSCRWPAQPLALATNQGLIYVLSMVVVGGLVGAGALGYDVVAGFSQGKLFGKGLAAGLAIVLLGIMLDRITQAAARRAGPAERAPTRSGRTAVTTRRPAPTIAPQDGSSPGRHQMQIARRTGRGRGRCGRRRGRRSAWSPAGAAGRRSAAPVEPPRAAPPAKLRHRSTSRSTLGRLRGRTRRSSRYVAENKLGCKVVKKNLKEQVSWQGFGTGEVDAVLENWGHDDLKKKYITEQKIAVDAGPTGNKGIIGWYVPPWLAKAVPGHHRLEQPQQVRRRCSRPPSPAARASCSTATRRSSPTTRRW